MLNTDVFSGSNTTTRVVCGVLVNNNIISVYTDLSVKVLD